MKRLLDFIGAFCGILILSPGFLIVLALIWLQDFKSPLYISLRVGKDGKKFKMVKLRSMKVHVANSGPVSTSSDDTRITSIGHVIRKFKLDELSQLWNVFKGDMSLVGPRPNVKEETDLYTYVERKILSVKPGITDFSSIIFSDESNILTNMENPDLAYNQLIRPWKSRLALFYIQNNNVLTDIKILYLTVYSLINKNKVLNIISKILASKNASKDLIEISKRRVNLKPTPPPGSNQIVFKR
jgi:lipopolysaccharide/colanic/teichoic acid biosynthesis glycosyltransferase